MVYDVKYVRYDARCLMSDVWCMILSVWCMMPVLWCQVYDTCDVPLSFRCMVLWVVYGVRWVMFGSRSVYATKIYSV